MSDELDCFGDFEKRLEKKQCDTCPHSGSCGRTALGKFVGKGYLKEIYRDGELHYLPTGKGMEESEIVRNVFQDCVVVHED